MTTLYRVLYHGHNGKQDWHGIRRCPHTAQIEKVSVDQADWFETRAKADDFRKQYEHLYGGSRTVIRAVEFQSGYDLPPFAFVAPFADFLSGIEQQDDEDDGYDEVLAELPVRSDVHQPLEGSRWDPRSEDFGIGGEVK